MTDYCLTLLRVLLHLGRVGKDTITLKKITQCLPQNHQSKLGQTISELSQLGIIEKVNDAISIKRDRRDDVCRWLDPEPDPIIKSIKPIEDVIPKYLEKTPFLTTEGSHKVKGVIDKYAFHKSRIGSRITVYLVSDNHKKSTINLGSVYEQNSLYRRGLVGIDTTFGTKIFTKAMLNQLGHSIVGNRQPVKALIDIMIYDGFLIKIDEKHFMRTAKEIPSANGLLIEQ